MALIKCPECGKELSDKAKNCIHCGYPLTQNRVNPQQIIAFAQNNKKWLVIISVVIVGVIALCLSGSSMSKDEKIAYQAAVELKGMLKDPDSFRLYDEILIIRNYEEDGNLSSTYMIIKYGGANSYGGIITKEAIFVDGKYIMDYGDEPSGTIDDDEYWEQVVVQANIEMWAATGDTEAHQSSTISTEKIKDKMGLNP